MPAVTTGRGQRCLSGDEISPRGGLVDARLFGDLDAMVVTVPRRDRSTEVPGQGPGPRARSRDIQVGGVGARLHTAGANARRRCNLTCLRWGANSGIRRQRSVALAELPAGVVEQR